ncbi:MAG: lysostaphin resistance A-like protein [Kordiimonas sp.]
MTQTFEFLRHIFSKHAFLSAVLITALSVGLMKTANFTFSDTAIVGDNIASFTRYMIVAALFYVMIHIGWAKAAGLTSFSITGGAQYWWATTLPLILVGGLNLISTSWDSLVFKPAGLIQAFFSDFSVGLFEEILLRGVCFYILCRAWRDYNNGLIKAALVQALIFGLFHIFNLATTPAVDVIAQVIYATLLGIGFAGIVSYTRSIWLAVILHTFINAAGNLDKYFQADYVRPSTDPASYAAAITLIFIIVVLPNLYLLKKIQTRQS